MAKKSYTADDIQILEGTDAVRKRPAMYLGSTDENGLLHCIFEVADNGVDEARAKRNDYVGIALRKEQIWVTDNGGGIPVEKHKKSGKSTLTSIMTSLHSGGKFGSDAYDDVGGVHGLGVTCVNATAAKFQVWTCRNKQWWTQCFTKGHPDTPAPVKCKAPTLPKGLKATGTAICYTPDSEIFGKSKLNTTSHEETLLHWCQMKAYLTAGTTISFSGQNDKWTNYKYTGGLKDYIKDRVEIKGNKMIELFAETTDRYDIALAFVELPSLETNAYTNGLHNGEGGFHKTAMLNAIMSGLWANASKDDYFEMIDCQNYIYGVINARLKEPQFSTQTKEKLVDKRANDIYDVLTASLTKFFAKHKTLTQVLCVAASEAYAARHNRKEDRGLAKKLSTASKQTTLLPGKLAQAFNCKPKDRELYTVEGDSASGTAKLARDGKFQEILALRGKILNACRVDDAKLVANTQVFNILLAMGYSPTAKDPYAKLRVLNKLILLSDADDDGLHINLLVLATLSKRLPRLFEQKIVHVVKAPQFYTTIKDKHFYGQTKQQVIDQLPKGSKIELKHLKGWGEATPRILRETAFDPSTRQLQLITVQNTTEIQKFVTLMDDSDEGKLIRRQLVGIDLGSID